jgi:ketosteroid isomerase-like protein
MAEILVSNLEKDGERRPFVAHGFAMLGSAGGLSVLRGYFEPGWRWSTDVGPIAKTESCQVHHHGYVIAGSMRARLDDGTEREFATEDLFDLPPGHDAWVTSRVPCEVIDVSPAATTYARPAGLAEADDSAMKLVRRGYQAFNTGDMDALRNLLAHDVLQHVPGHGPFAGTHKGVDAVLDYYAKLAESTDGTFRADLVDVHGDGGGHVLAIHQTTAVRNGRKRASRASILFTFVGDKATDLLELYGDLPGDEAFFS